LWEKSGQNINMMDQERPIEIQVEALRSRVAANAARVRELGHWPAWVSADSLAERVPQIGDTKAAGFDAGVACALDLIPRNKQELSASLHGAYTPEVVTRVLREIENLDPESETAWWLAACNICKEGGIDQTAFLQQIEDFKKLAENPEDRAKAARSEYEAMTSRFTVASEFGEDVPFGTEDGCMQGAYLKGYPFAVQWAENYGVFFIGTFHESLGLEDFPWSEEKDEKGRAKSGPVWGSKQFIKCATKDELKAALVIVKNKFAPKLQALKDKKE
jgi:hypothetical protein